MMASDPYINAKEGHLRIVVLLILLLALLLAPTFCLAQPDNTRGAISKNYADGLSDVLDKTTDMQTSAKPMYDISNASFTMGDYSMVVKMTMASAVDRDGFYIFQSEVNGVKGYKFYFAQDAFGAQDPTGGPITVSGNAVGNSVEITVPLSLLGTVSAFDLDNVSAQDATLNYIDVLDCTPKSSTAESDNAITLSILSERQLLLRYVTTYSDSRAMKAEADTDKNGYVDAPESQGYARSMESGLTTYITQNQDTYYKSNIYVNGERPRDIAVMVSVWIDEPVVLKADASSITIEYYLTYQDNWGSTITLSIPLATIVAKTDQGQSTFVMSMPDSYSVDIGATDQALRQSVFQNGSGLSLGTAGLSALTDARYEVVVKTPMNRENGPGYGIYVIITLISITIAFCIFVGYQMWTKRRTEGNAIDGGRGGLKDQGRGEEAGREPGKKRGKKKGQHGMDKKHGKKGPGRGGN